MKNHIYLAIAFILFFISLSYAQENANTLYNKAYSEARKGNPNTAIKYFKQSLELRLNHPLIEPDNIETIQQKIIPLENITVDSIAKTYRNIGTCYRMEKHFPNALKYLSFSIDIYQLTDTFENKLKDLGTAYYSLADVYDELGEHRRGIEAANEADNLHSARKDKNTKEVLRGLNLLADLHRKNGTYRQGLIYCVEGDSLYRSLSSIDKNKYEDKIGRIYNTQGAILHEQKKHETALSYYRKALEYNFFEPEITENNIAYLLIQLDRLREAEALLTSVLDKEREKYGASYHYIYALIFENFAELEIARGNNIAALDYSQLALINLTDNFRSKNINDNPAAKNDYIYNKPDLLRVLDLKAQAALKSGNTELAYDTYQELDGWINEFYKDLSTKASKLTWIDRAHATYGNAIEVALLKNDKEQAFEYAEKAHAVLLWQSLSQQAARNLLSEDDQEKIDDLNAQIRQADQQYRYGEISIDALRTLERERETLEKTFDANDAYTQRKYKSETTTVSDIQSNIIDDHTAFIEYYQAKETLYIFTITKNGIEITQENAAGLKNDITAFVNHISGKSNIAFDQNEEGVPVLMSNNNTGNYHVLAHKLYQQLIPSIIRSNNKINRLVIVPDREIGMLPFAALTTQTTSGKLNKNTPFLVKKYTTNYLYSAGSYLQLQQKKADQKYCFAGIAPVEYQLKDWKKLPHSEGELDGIKPLHWMWNREILVREAATKAAFEHIIKEGYRTVQVSTHAVFGENGGQIIFHDSALNQDEIDQLEINTHRLILSACETGVGIQNQGEGILSLGWNFAYKGVPSITMTHWSVSDNSTKDIMIQYHQNLNDGTPADQALQNAQQYYLENIISDSQANPCYWAAIFHTGNVK